MSSTEVVAYTGLIIAFIATLFTALKWASAYRAADSARRSAKAAEDAAAIAKEMGQHSTRPWVTLAQIEIKTRWPNGLPLLLLTNRPFMQAFYRCRTGGILP